MPACVQSPIASRPRRLAIGERLNVLVDQAYRRGVAFVMMDMPRKTGVRRLPAGTAFFLSYEISSSIYIIYAVTARHVIEAGELKNAQGLFLRVVHEDGIKDIPMTADQWVRHPDTDVAIASVESSPEIKLYAKSHKTLALPDRLQEHKPPVGEGDDVFFVGLFTRFYGEDQILPIVRFGNIALMPYEPVMAKLSVAKDAKSSPISAYLVEARSWGGHSGSPVWVYFSAMRDPTKGPTIEDFAGVEPMLLGLVQGHYAIDPTEDFIGDLPDERSVAANAGIAIVVPAESIMEVLMSKELQTEREEILDQDSSEQSGPIADTSIDVLNVDEFDHFEDLTQKIVQVPKSEIDEKRKK
jgi:hypothetical protein